MNKKTKYSHGDLQDIVAERTRNLMEEIEELKQAAENWKARETHLNAVITQHKTLKQELRRQTLASEQAEEIANFGQWVWNETTDTSISVSAGVLKIYGRSMDDFLKLTSIKDGEQTLLHPEDWPAFRDLNEEFRLNGTAYSSQHRILRPDGEVRWVNEHGQALEYTDDGKIAISVGVMYDVTEQKRAARHTERLMQAVEQSQAMVFITDTLGVIEYVNRKFKEITGYSSQEAIGRNMDILDSGEMPKNVYKQFWNNIKAGREWSGEFKDKCKDGSTFWAYASISPVMSEYGEITHFISMHEDITERKEIETRERHAKEQAEIANKAKSELMANMSHELRTPLNAIIGFSETVRAETFGSVGSAKNREYLDDIYSSGQHLLNLINDILDASAIEAGALELREENVSIPDIVEPSIRLIRPLAEDGQVAVSSSISPEIPLLYADKRRVKQIFLNLLSNAVKFTPAGGEICVSGQLNDDGSLTAFITDTGMGMDEEEVTLAMSTFGQVDSGLNRKHEGTGLGLPMTKGLIELHGGALEIKSKKGNGTSVAVTFPKQRVVINVR